MPRDDPDWWMLAGATITPRLIPYNLLPLMPALARLRWPWALAFAASSVCVALLATAAVVLPQWQRQLPARQGLVSLHLAADGSLRLWNRPIAATALPALLRRAERLDSSTRVRLVVAPQVPWGVVQDLLPRLDSSTLHVDLELPPPARP